MTEKTSLLTSAALVLGLVAIIVTVLCAHLLAQAISGDTVGTVTDATQAAVRGATVTAENAQTGVKTTTTTHASGEYRLSDLPVGSYTISDTAPGFGTTKLRDVSVKLNQTITTIITL
jgi:hypothetical protein